MAKEQVNHPEHYGGKDNPYEAIKVIEAWNLGFNLGNAVKYISRAGKKDDIIQELEKAKWYLEREISNQRASIGMDDDEDIEHCAYVFCVARSTKIPVRNLKCDGCNIMCSARRELDSLSAIYDVVALIDHTSKDR